MLLPRRPTRRESGSRFSPAICCLAAGLGLIAVVTLPAPALTVRVTPRRPPARGLPWLAVRGGRISTLAGQSVILRGFNDSSLLQTGSSPLPSALTGQDAQIMEDQGFDVVRIPISWSLLEPEPGHFSQSYLARIRAMVSLCASHDLYSVLDMHTEDFGVGFGGSGAPAWLYVPGIPDLHLPGLPAAWQRHLSPAVNAALAYFWLFPNWQTLYWQAWSIVARMFRDDSNVAGFDLYNEPHPLPIPPGIFATHLLWPFYAQGIRAISRVDPNHLFILEGDLFGELPTAIRPLRARDVVYSTHLYAGSILGAPFTGSPAPLASEWREAVHEAAQLPGPYWVGEMGIPHHGRLADRWAEDEIELSDQHLAGWAWWEWEDPNGWGVSNAQGNIDEGWLRVLSQPFIRSSPGELTSMDYSPRRRMLKALIKDARPGSAVEVSWPKTLGRPRLLSGCATTAAGTGSIPGLLTLHLLTASCLVQVGT